MNNATLYYRINYNNENKQLRLENQSLYLIDKITSGFKNEDDFIKHYYNREKIDSFIKENGNTRGSLYIQYTKDIQDKKELELIFDTDEKIVLNEDFYNNQITEIEKARKLLFNSKNQLFTKVLLTSHILDTELNRMIDLDSEECKFALNNDVEVKNINGKYYVNFKELLYYRTRTVKLGILREAYQDMLDVLKDRIMRLDGSTFYFYNRELRLLIDRYKNMINLMTIKNFKVNESKINVLSNYCINK